MALVLAIVAVALVADAVRFVGGNRMVPEGLLWRASWVSGWDVLLVCAGVVLAGWLL